MIIDVYKDLKAFIFRVNQSYKSAILGLRNIPEDMNIQVLYY
jgi:hypothetical protein